MLLNTAYGESLSGNLSLVTVMEKSPRPLSLVPKTEVGDQTLLNPGNASLYEYTGDINTSSIPAQLLNEIQALKRSVSLADL